MTRMCAFVAAVGALLLPASASADRVYHSEHLPLVSASGVQHGFVQNIHPNGPQVYAHEIYTLRHAVPGTYQVSLNVFPTSLNCTVTESTFALQTATLETNAVGNGRAEVKFAPEDVASLRGMTLSISWTVTGPATYVTGCTVVELD